MMLNVSIDFSLSNIWRSWHRFRRGKKRTPELEKYSYNLEENLYQLYTDLNNGTYQHGSYRTFIVHDNKKRTISVTPIRDRIVHRLLYEYLIWIFNQTFIYDAWSCRRGKGLIGAIDRTQKILRGNSHSFVWRTDIRKFFDSVNCEILLDILGKKIKDKKALWLLEETIGSYHNQNLGTNRERERERGKGRANRHTHRQSHQPNLRQHLPQ